MFHFSVDWTPTAGIGPNDYAEQVAEVKNEQSIASKRRPDVAGAAGATVSANVESNPTHRVLLVEDDALNTLLMSTKLSKSKELAKYNFVVDEYVTADKALACSLLRDSANINYYSVIIMDEHFVEDLPPQCASGDIGSGVLPLMKGSEAIRKLRKLGCTSIIVACSGNCLPEDTAMYSEAGATLWWPKPYPTATEMDVDFQRLLSPASADAQ
jgi:CheY-like chemotaxis protein